MAFHALYESAFADFQLAAPTGPGKTVLGEFAVHLALAGGRKCFYTTPIKALSNQKYSDLVRRYSAAKVGLLTGDNSINGEAPVVVMTTEVLRNMLYAGSPTLAGLGYVVLDEVHYPAGRIRGGGGPAGQPGAAAGRAAGPLGGPEGPGPAGPREGRAGWAADQVPGRPPPGRDRAAQRRRPAPGDHVRLQPGRLRRRCAALAEHGPAADHAGGSGQDHRPGAGADSGHPRGGPAGSRLPGLAGRPAAGDSGPSPRDAAHLPAGRGTPVRGRADPGGIRHPDPRAGHQHAGPDPRHPAS